MCPVHNDIPELQSPGRLPERFWELGPGHFRLYLTRPGVGEQSAETEPHLRPFGLRFAPSPEEIQVVGAVRIGSQGLKVAGEPSWAQDPEWYTCACGSEMAFIAQVPENFPFPKNSSAPEQPDTFSADDYCLFLGNEVYLFGCTAQCHPEAIWPVLQN